MKIDAVRSRGMLIEPIGIVTPLALRTNHCEVVFFYNYFLPTMKIVLIQLNAQGITKPTLTTMDE